MLSFLAGCSFLRSTLVVRPFVSGTGEAETGEHMVGHLPGQRELVSGEIHHAISAGLSASQLQKVTENTGASKRRFCATMTAFRAVKMARIGQVFFLVKDVHARSGFMGRSSEPAKVCDFVYLLKDPHCVQGLARETWNALDGMLDLCRLP